MVQNTVIAKRTNNGSNVWPKRILRNGIKQKQHIPNLEQAVCYSPRYVAAPPRLLLPPPYAPTKRSEGAGENSELEVPL